MIIRMIRCFPAHDELGTCRTSLVSLEQPVLCIPVRPAKFGVNHKLICAADDIPAREQP